MSQSKLALHVNGYWYSIAIIIRKPATKNFDIEGHEVRRLIYYFDYNSLNFCLCVFACVHVLINVYSSSLNLFWHQELHLTFKPIKQLSTATAATDFN